MPSALPERGHEFVGTVDQLIPTTVLAPVRLLELDQIVSVLILCWVELQEDTPKCFVGTWFAV